jgi:hypothetical protein
MYYYYDEKKIRSQSSKLTHSTTQRNGAVILTSIDHFLAGSKPIEHGVRFLVVVLIDAFGIHDDRTQYTLSTTALSGFSGFPTFLATCS